MLVHREEYAELCPEWLHGTALQDAIESLKRGNLHSLCMTSEYSFYQVGTPTERNDLS